MILYKLDKEISGEKILKDIQQLIFKHQKNLSNKILCINIREIIDHTGDNPIPKIPYHEPQ